MDVQIDRVTGMAPGGTVGAVSTTGELIGTALPLVPAERGFLLVPLGEFQIPPKYPWPVSRQGSRFTR
jgi:hypothetical protein